MGQIMLNKSFIGSWGQTNMENIPHEVINLFRSDNGKLYIYVPPYGGYSAAQHCDVDTVVLTGSWNQKTTEVLYVLKGLTRLHNGGKKATAQDRAKLVEVIKRENIRYGGKYLHEIKMSSEEESSVFYMTFEAETILKPRKKMCFSWNTDAAYHDEKKDIFAFSTGYKYHRLYGYLSEEDASVAAGILSDETLWQTVDIQPVNAPSFTSTSHHNFIQLIQKEYDENIYTTLLCAFFNACPSLFSQFVQEVLQIPVNEHFTVRKEVTTTDKKGRLDLLAEGPTTVIAIENKLQSGLNGIDKHNKLSQLTTYISFVEESILKGRTGYYYLFEPNYNDIDIAQFDAQRGLEWKKCQYSSIYRFMDSYRQQLKECPLGKYADDFVDALYLHTQQMKDIVQQRFLEAIHKK